MKYSIEYPVRCSPTILYEFLSTSSGLQEWFAEKVEDSDQGFNFFWSGHSQHAKVLEKEENKFVRFQWDDSPDDEFFEFSIDKSEITNQTILVIHDFAEKSDLKDARLLWETQVKDLFHRLGN